jgi:signal peptidase II
MNGKKIIALIALIIVIDQAIKFYIKLNYFIGEEHLLLGTWARLHFVENEGMAWGLKFGGDFGKIILTLFRLIAVIWGAFLIRGFIAKKYHNGFIICAALIFAGAVGNLIDSLFYGMIFEQSVPYTTQVAVLMPKAGGYASFLHGKVVDMFYFPIVQNAHFPSWFPIWGGEEFEFFRPVFNFADASISVGVITLFIFQNKFFGKENDENVEKEQIEAPVSNPE